METHEGATVGPLRGYAVVAPGTDHAGELRATIGLLYAGGRETLVTWLRKEGPDFVELRVLVERQAWGLRCTLEGTERPADADALLLATMLPNAICYAAKTMQARGDHGIERIAMIAARELAEGRAALPRADTSARSLPELLAEADRRALRDYDGRAIPFLSTSDGVNWTARLMDATTGLRPIEGGPRADGADPVATVGELLADWPEVVAAALAARTDPAPPRAT